METLSTIKYMINQFCTVALGDTIISILQGINEEIDRTFKELKQSANLENLI
jgi:phage terminase Nu1 subunit (DNA packaging protein)